MKIAFYAPLKSPNHTIPSGDRQMARALVNVLQKLGAEVEIISEFRSFSKTPHQSDYLETASDEISRISAKWQISKPDLWFSYHPYYKAPDFLATSLCHQFNLPVFTAEASLATKRKTGVWAASQAPVEAMVKSARANFFFTKRDLQGLCNFVADESLVHLPAFIDVPERPPSPNTKQIAGTVNLVTMGMMRGGVKFDSYRMLASVLARLNNRNWHLAIIGDGNDRANIETLFKRFDKKQISWKGEVTPKEVALLLAQGQIFVWPGFGEAYGLCYLEAQAAGLPIIAQDTAGVPSVVKNGKTGFLTPENAVDAMVEKLNLLMSEQPLRERLGAQAKQFVLNERNLKSAQKIIKSAIDKWL